jgi:hypothetical protein
MASEASVLLLCTWFYLPPYWDSFVGDDFVQQWRIRELISSPTRAYQVFHPFWTTWYYRPLQHLWFLANRLTFSLNPFAYYYLQLCWHLLAVCLLYRLARLLRLPAWAGLLTAVLFAINGQHQPTVSWISSIAIVMGTFFSLAAAVAYLCYLDPWQPGQPQTAATAKGKIRTHPRLPAFPSWLWQMLSLGFCLLAMLAHEEGVLAPLFLFAIWRTQPVRPSIRRADVFFFAASGLLLAGYLALQIIRPNVHIVVEGAYYGRLLTALQPGNMGQFALEIIGRWALLEQFDLPALVAQRMGRATVACGMLVLAIIGFWRGRRSVRLGLIWAGLHLGFIYFGLWSQRPELFDGRHLYNAWVGVSLFLGGGLAQLSLRLASRKQQWQAATALLFAAFVFLGLHLWQIEQGMAGFHRLTQRVQAAEAQMKAILPTATEETEVFAARFLLTPSYFAPVAGVWYGRPGLGGGSLDALKQYKTLSPHFYLFDYADGQLYNLAPELQQHLQTILLWRHEPEIHWQKEGATVPLSPGEVAADKLIITRDVPRLAMGVRGKPGHTFRILVNTDTLFTHTVQPGEADWQEVLLPLDEYTNEMVLIQLQLMGDTNTTGYWANPRLVNE